MLGAGMKRYVGSRSSDNYGVITGALADTFDLEDNDQVVILSDETEQFSIDDIIETVEKIFTKKGSGYAKKSDLDELNIETVSIPASFSGLEAQMMPPRLEEQLFRVVDVVEDEDCVTVTARHVWYDNLENFTLWKPTEKSKYTGAAACRNVLTNAISPVNSRVASDCTDTIIGKDLDFERKNLVEAFLDPENGICEKYGLSLLRDNWDFYCLKDVGYDRGTVIQNGKNLLGVERDESIENLVTRIAPMGKDEKGEIVWLNHNGKKYLDSNYIDDYSYPRTELYDTGIQIGKDDVTAQNINDKLLQAAQKRFSEDKVDLPEIKMTIEFLSLGDTEEYVQYRNLDKVYLYDILTIKDTVRGYDYSAQVIGVEHDILTGMLNSVTIGNINKADGSRKIASWQVPEVDGTNIRLKSIMAGSFESGAIQAEDLADHIIAYAHIAQATIDELTSDSIVAVTAQIHEIIAGSITAEDIQAGSISSIVIASGAITTDKIEAGAVTADRIASEAVTADKIEAGAVTAQKIAAEAVTSDKIAANAVTAGKIAAGAINADKIDANAISAINAKLGTAVIVDGYIQNADIDYAHVKDIAIDEAIITTSITEKGIADRLYINRLMVSYGQMVEATIGDLVIGASNGNYYHIDVDWDEDGIPTLVPTQVTTPSAAEIAAGHTSDGKTIIEDVGTFNELSSEDFYAINAIIDRITAKRIDVDELWARQAFINKLMVTDISSNTYIQSTIGTWTSGSTITQTIDGLNSRIASLGYGTIFYQTTQPDPAGVVTGDVWIEPIDDNTWEEIGVYTWADLEGWTWDQVAGQYRMYVWDGQTWKLLYDNLIVSELMTEINQTAYAVTLKADKTVVDTLSEDVTEFAATLEVQAAAITAAVSSVNEKVAAYTQISDPSEDPTISLSSGDIWVKAAGDGTWAGLEDFTWSELESFAWDELAGANVFTWDGEKWIQTSDYGAVVQNRTMIEQTDQAIRLEAEKREQINDRLDVTRAELTVANDRISAEVMRATTAEGGKIDKTVQYQTADAIVSEAVRQAGMDASGNYISKTSVYQTADSIVQEAVRQAAVDAADGFIAKTSSLQTADSIVTEAVRQAAASASGAYIAKTSRYQTADSIVSEAVRQSTASVGNAFIEKTTLYQSAEAIVLAAESYTDDHSYAKTSGISITSSGVDVTGSKHINLDINANNYVHINTNGIEMKGKRVTVDGNEMWARDDIIVMNPNASSSWRRSVAAIESHMSGKHDWVLIKPYYNAEINFVGKSGLTNQETVVNAEMNQTEAYRALGDQAAWYKYDVEVDLMNYGGFRSANLYVFFSNKPFTFSDSDRITQAIAQADFYFHDSSASIPGGGNATTLTFTLTSTSINLCSEGETVYYYINGLSNYTSLYLTSLKLKATTDATTARVPCTTYYYP